MKNITGTVIQTNNQPYANKKIVFALQDRYERNVAAMSKDGQIIASQEVTTDANGAFSVFLESLDAFKFDYFYKMSFDGTIAPLKLFVYGGLAAVVDYKKCLLKQPRLDMFYEFVEQTQEYRFTTDMELLFETFFAGENEFFKQDENNLIETYIKYADGKIDNDAVMALDEYLATITGEE